MAAAQAAVSKVVEVDDFSPEELTQRHETRPLRR